MEIVDYRSKVLDDALDAMENVDCEDFDEFFDYCYIDDSVTGNASGSYTMSRAEAEELIVPAMFDGDFLWWLENMGITVSSLKDPETVDVYIRIYSLDCIRGDLESEWDERHDDE